MSVEIWKIGQKNPVGHQLSDETGIEEFGILSITQNGSVGCGVTLGKVMGAQSTDWFSIDSYFPYYQLFGRSHKVKCAFS